MGEKKAKTEVKNKKGIIIASVIATILFVVVIVSLVIAINSGVFGPNYKKLAGNYKLIAMSDEEQEYTQENLNMLKRFGITVSLELRKDGTGTIDLFGEKMELTFDNKNMTYKDEAIPYTLKDGKITIEDENRKMTFEKVVE